MKPFLIGVAGGSGSGKTTVVQELLRLGKSQDIVRLAHDDYYRRQSNKPMAERVKTNYDHPDSLETSLLIEHLKQLLAGNAIAKPTYDFVQHTRSEVTQMINPTKVIVVEGILILENKQLRDLLDLKIFVDTDADIRFIRRLRRDVSERGRQVEQVIEQYLATVQPMHLEFVEPSKRYADIIIPEGGLNAVALDLILARVKEVIASK